MDLGLSNEAMANVGGSVGFGGGILVLWRAYCERQDKIAIFKRLDEQDREISEHAILVAREYALKSDITKLLEHIDRQFSELRTQIFAAVTGGKPPA